MIAALRGTVLRVGSSFAVIDVGGVGYGVQLTPAHASSLRAGAEVSLVTSLIVREDSMTLFGFETPETLDVFTSLVGVTGVGPRSALAVLSELSAGEVASAVATEDDAAFRRVSGIGPKTAKLIVVSLAGKLFAVPTETSPAPAGDSAVRDSVVAALVGLGWQERSASEAVDAAIEGSDSAASETVPGLLRRALAQLGPATKHPGGAR